MYALDTTGIPYVAGVAAGLITGPANLATSVLFSEASLGK